MDKIKNNDYNKKNENKNHENKKNHENIIVKELNYNRINKIVKKSKNSQKDLKGDNLKIIKIILLQFHHKIKRTSQIIFDLLI